MDILNLFGDPTPELGTTEIATALGLHKSTVAGLIYTLEANGYLAQNPVTRKYRLGYKLIERASVMLAHLEIRQVALPYLQELRDQFGETANMAILDGADMVYIERLLSPRVLGMRSEIGKRMLAHSTALGKAILSCLPADEVQEFIKRNGLPAVTPKTITDPDKLIQELEKTRRRGFAVDDEENEPGGRCVAAPVFDHTGKPVAAISISAPAARLPLSEIPRVGERVRKAAAAISRSLGYSSRSS